MVKKFKLGMLFALICFTLIAAITVGSKSTLGQTNGDSLLITNTFSLTEYANYKGENQNVDQINITLPSSKWQVKDMELNFTDINLGEEVVSIEEGATSSKSIYKGVDGYGVQLNITQDILLLGVYIYGYIELTPISPVYIQINGYDVVNHWPNNTMYGSPVPINMSIMPNWYLQSFSEPIPLSEGYYYLVVNGSGYEPSDNSKHWWYLNEYSNNTSLYTSKLDGTSWSIEAQGKPFTHKLVQTRDKSYSPESIEMGIIVNDIKYNISNGVSPASGFVKISNINLPLNNGNLNIPILHDQPVSLIFNVSYDLNLESQLAFPGTCLISSDNDNQWNLNPNILREFNNHSIKFTFPENWDNFIIRRNNVDITSQVEINLINHYIYIINETIVPDTQWRFTASSPQIVLGLIVDRTQFYPGQELKFFIAEPLLNGNYTFKLEDPLNDIVYNTSKLIPPGLNSFTYTIPSNALDGTYKAFIFWHNTTDAGMISQEFSIILPFTIDWAFIITISIIIGIIIAGMVSAVVLIKKLKQKKLSRIEEINNRFMDILNLNYIIVIEKKSSLNVYDQAFTEKKFNTTLITGFLEAIRTFGIDISGDSDHSQTIRLEYHNSKILMTDFKSFRLIFIMKELPSSGFYKLIDVLSHEIEDKYGAYLKSFMGNLQPFSGIEELLKKHLGTSFLYPLKIVKSGKVKVTPIEKIVIEKAGNILKNKNNNYFYITQLIEGRDFGLKEFGAIFSLIDKNIFSPII